MDVLSERFGQSVSCVGVRGHVEQLYQPFLDVVANEMMTNVDVLRHFVVDVVLGDVPSALVVDVDGDRQLELASFSRSTV